MTKTYFGTGQSQSSQRRTKLSLGLKDFEVLKDQLKLPPAQLVKGNPKKHVFAKIKKKGKALGFASVTIKM